jgi:hypothetical protein
MKSIKLFIKEVIHNCIVHPVLPFLPRKVGEQLHKVNGEWTYK